MAECFHYWVMRTVNGKLEAICDKCGSVRQS